MRPDRHRRLLAALTVLGAALAMPGVAAHSDVAVEGVLALAPGASGSVPFDLHWHRIVGSVTSSGAPVAVAIVDATTGEAHASLPPDDVHALDVLVTCCPSGTWAPFRLVVTNAGASPAEVVVDARAMHDDFAVAAAQAESGIPTTAAVLAAIGGAYAWRARRRLDRPLAAEASRRALRRARVAWLVMASSGSVLALVGMLILPRGPFAGTVGALALLPRVPGFFGAVAWLGVMTLVLWFVVVHHWTSAIGRDAHGRRGVVVLGAVLTTGVLGLAATFAVERASWLVPVMFAVAFAAPVALVTGLVHVREGGPGRPAPPGPDDP